MIFARAEQPASTCDVDSWDKKKVKQPYFTSITRDSNSTDKLEVDGTLILPPSLHQCSVLRVFKASQSYTERREVETRM